MTTCSAADDELCTNEGLVSALAAAEPGDTIEPFSAEYRGSFTLLSGVSLLGVDGTSIVGDRGAPIVVEADGEVSTIAGVLIESPTTGSDAASAVIAVGPGSSVIEDVSIHASPGYGIVAQNLDALTLTRVTLTGDANVELIAEFGDPENCRAQVLEGGLLAVKLEGVPSVVVFEDVEVTGFAGLGVGLVNSIATWNGGRVGGGFVAGIIVEETELSIADVEVSELGPSNVASNRSFVFGVVASASSHVTSTDLAIGSVVFGNGRAGMLLDGVHSLRDDGEEDETLVCGHELLDAWECEFGTAKKRVATPQPGCVVGVPSGL